MSRLLYVLGLVEEVYDRIGETRQALQAMDRKEIS